MMKKLLALVLIALLMPFAYAEEENPFLCDCETEEEACVCFLQEGDIGPAVEGLIAHLKEKGYLDQKHSRGVFDSAVTGAIRAFQKDADLDETGTVDDNTLTYLIFGELSSEEQNLAWVPTDGGVCVHGDPTCSGMLAPRKISIRNALALGLPQCEHCLQMEPIKEGQNQ